MNLFSPLRVLYPLVLAAGALVPPVAFADQASIPLGQSARSGAVCVAQAENDDPAAQIPFAKAWGIACRGWDDTTLGHLYVFRGNFSGEPAVWRKALAARVDCERFGAANVSGLSGVAHAACTAKPGKTLYSVYTLKTEDGFIVAEGFEPLDELLQVGLRIEAGVADPPSSSMELESEPASPNTGGVESLARAANAAQQAPGWLRERAYIENQSWRFTDAERDFRLLAADPAMSRRDRAFNELNWALNISNEGRFEEADAQFQALNSVASDMHDPELDMLALNYRALHYLNQSRFADAQHSAEAALKVGGARTVSGTSPKPGVSGDAIEIGGELAATLNHTAKPSGFRTAALTASQRIQILSAQAFFVIGCAEAASGDRTSARKSLTESARRLDKGALGRSAGWLRAEIALQMARLDIDDHRPGEAQTGLTAMVELLQKQQNLSASPVEARLYIELGRAESALNDSDQAIKDYATGMELFRQTRGTLGYSANEAAPYFDLLVARAKRSPSDALRYQSLFFDAAQSVVSLATARTVADLAKRVGQGDSNSAAVARATQDAQREATVRSAQIERASAQPGYSPEQKAVDDAETQRLAAEVHSLRQQLLAANPRYGQLVASTATLDDVRKVLNPGEIYVKTVLLSKSGYAIAITPGSVDIYSIGLSRSQAQDVVTKLRHPFDAESTLPRFDAAVSYTLFTTIFGPVADKVAAAGTLIYEPDGALVSLPASVFVVKAASAKTYQDRLAQFIAGKDLDLYHDLAWLGRNTDVSLSVSAAGFLQSRALPPSRAQRVFIGVGAPSFQNSSDPRLFSLLTKDHQGVGAESCNRVRLQMASALSRPLPGAAETIEQIGRGLGAEPRDIMLGQAFTDTGMEQRGDLDNYRVVFFGTHGLLPNNEACLPEPALVTSLGGGESDGLLDASEILNLKLDADLVVLSACNTGGVGSSSADRTGLTGSGEALGGLARDFIYAGSRGLIVSQWEVDTGATLELMKRLFRANAATQGDALRQAERALMDSKDFSHPYYWAAFSLVGDGARAMPARMER